MEMCALIKGQLSLNPSSSLKESSLVDTGISSNITTLSTLLTLLLESIEVNLIR